MGDKCSTCLVRTDRVGTIFGALNTENNSVSRKYTKKGRRNTRLIWSLLFHDDRSKPGRNSANASLIPADPVSGNQRRRALSEENGQSFPLVGCLPAKSVADCDNLKV